MTEGDRIRKRVRFVVNPDGSVSGDDGTSDRLAATLRYVCRMSSQIGDLLGDGELERFSTLGSVAVLAKVSGVSPRLRIEAEVETQPATPRARAMNSGMAAREAINVSLRRVTLDLASDWSVLVTDDRRLVGSVEYESSGRATPPEILEVGARALAVLGALDEQLRETAVRLDFVRGSVLIVAIGPHTLITHGDKFEVTEVVSDTVSAVQGLLAGVNLVGAISVARPRRIRAGNSPQG